MSTPLKNNMKILVTGANGYIGSQLIPKLLKQGHEVVAMVRHHTHCSKNTPSISYIIADLLDFNSLMKIPDDIDAVYYLVHSMKDTGSSFPEKEELAIRHLLSRLEKMNIRQIIYLSGLSGDQQPSRHLQSRLQTELLIKQSGQPYTILRAGIIIGTGSASFEIIRDLVEKLPVMVAPKWVQNLCQPIAIDDILRYLTSVLNHPDCINKAFDVGSQQRLSYKEILLGYAKARGLKRSLFVIPVLTPRLSAYWLWFITSVDFQLATSLVDSIKNQAICREETIHELFSTPCMSYAQSLQLALRPLEQLSKEERTLNSHFGCFTNQQILYTEKSPESVTERLWSIGGANGWLYMDWAWKIRGWIDLLLGGVGLRQSQNQQIALKEGGTLDFWHIAAADREKRYLLLSAEMKLPGEAWLEFSIEPNHSGSKLVQTAFFRPKGVLGRLYWYMLLPFHLLIFRGMAKAIAKGIPLQDTKK